jgi:hypothetical protein
MVIAETSGLGGVGESGIRGAGDEWEYWEEGDCETDEGCREKHHQWPARITKSLRGWWKGIQKRGVEKSLDI